MKKEEVKKLIYKNENGYKDISASKQEKIFNFSEEYKKFLDEVRTEREAIEWLENIAKENGYVDINEVKYNFKTKRYSHDRFYIINRGKSMALVNIGKLPLTDGAHLLLSHVDCPRIDIKSTPLYEEGNICFLKTHYYGGIKKFQWISAPMALHGFIMLSSGKKIKIKIGDSFDEPAFMLPDLAIHISSKLQGERKYNELIKAEELNLIVGTIPLSDANENDKNPIKLNVLKILNQKYGISEKDLISAELSLVPAIKTRDIGFDASMIAGYGHDDRACVYATAMAAFNTNNPTYTSITYFLDREEIGSAGNAGATSLFVSDVFEQILSIESDNKIYHRLRKAQANSRAISADTTEAYNATWKQVFDTYNVPYINGGTTICKFTGSGGKRDSSEASTEFMTKLIEIFDNAKVKWQTGELGKVDEGGGGTVAKFLASYNMDVIDIGPACLSLHSPTELISKFDLYSSYEAYLAFLNTNDKFKIY